jgi:hypothetical protein
LDIIQDAQPTKEHDFLHLFFCRGHGERTGGRQKWWENMGIVTYLIFEGLPLPPRRIFVAFVAFAMVMFLC